MPTAMASLPLFPDHDGAAACAFDGAAPAPAEGFARAPQPTDRPTAETTLEQTAFEQTAFAPHGRAATEADAAASAATADPAPIARIAPEARGTGITLHEQAVATAASSSTGRGATLQRLANLWRADEIAQAAGHAATIASGFAALDAELPGGGWPQGQLVELLLDAPGIGELSLLAPALARCARDARACVWVLPGERAAAALPTLPYPPALAAAGLDLARALFVQPDTPREAFWAIEQSLRAAHLGALVGWLPQAAAAREESAPISPRASRDCAEQRARTGEYGEQRRHEQDIRHASAVCRTPANGLAPAGASAACRAEVGPRSRKLHAFEGEFRALRRLQLLASRQQALVFLLRDSRALHAPSPAALRLQLAAHDGALAVTILKRRGRPLLEPITLQVHPAHWNQTPITPTAHDAHAAPRPAGRITQAALVVQRWSPKAIFSC